MVLDGLDMLDNKTVPNLGFTCIPTLITSRRMLEQLSGEENEVNIIGVVSAYLVPNAAI